jgi:hypothetical protein
MIDTFIDKSTSLFGKRFIIAYWFPLFIVITEWLYIQAHIPYGIISEDWWEHFFSYLIGKESSLSSFLGLCIIYLVVITIAAYGLQVITRIIFLVYEGYWSEIFPYHSRMRLYVESLENKRKTKKLNLWLSLQGDLITIAQHDPLDEKRYATVHDRLVNHFPPEKKDILPTAFGNQLLAAEKYPLVTYGMDIIYWWPRLWLLLSDSERTENEELLIPLIALLNTATALYGGGIGYLVCFVHQIPLVIELGWFTILFEVGIFAGFIIAGYVFYHLAILQLIPYGDNIRAVADLHRFDLLKALHLPLPDTIQGEQKIWRELQEWIIVRNIFSAPGYVHYEK